MSIKGITLSPGKELKVKLKNAGITVVKGIALYQKIETVCLQPEKELEKELLKLAELV